MAEYDTYLNQIRLEDEVPRTYINAIYPSGALHVIHVVGTIPHIQLGGLYILGRALWSSHTEGQGLGQDTISTPIFEGLPFSLQEATGI